jgi:aquaporin related protein
MFIFLGLGCIKTAQNSQTFSQSQTLVSLSNQTILFISVGMGLSLLITAWVFYRITGGLFNPAVTLSLYLIGGLKPIRAILLTIAQIVRSVLNPVDLPF